jgi:hypothetical protein
MKIGADEQPSGRGIVTLEQPKGGINPQEMIGHFKAHCATPRIKVIDDGDHVGGPSIIERRSLDDRAELPHQRQWNQAPAMAAGLMMDTL